MGASNIKADGFEWICGGRHLYSVLPSVRDVRDCTDSLGCCGEAAVRSVQDGSILDRYPGDVRIMSNEAKWLVK